MLKLPQILYLLETKRTAGCPLNLVPRGCRSLGAGLLDRDAGITAERVVNFPWLWAAERMDTCSPIYNLISYKSSSVSDDHPNSWTFRSRKNGCPTKASLKLSTAFFHSSSTMLSPVDVLGKRTLRSRNVSTPRRPQSLRQISYTCLSEPYPAITYN